MRSPRWVGTLFFAEGLPASLVALVSAVLLKRLGLANDDIAFWVSALVLPWSLKPLWSPWFESARVRRLTVVVTEALMALALAGIAAGLGSEARVAITISLLAVVALSAATHDIAADGLFVSSLAPDVQKRLVGRISVAFNLAKLLAQGMLVVLAGRLEAQVGITPSWRLVCALFAAMLGGLAVHHALALPRGESSVSPGLIAPFLRAAASLLRRPHIGRLLVLVVAYRLAEGLLVRMAPLFLLDAPAAGGLGLTTAELGLFYGGLGTCAFMAGALLGGKVSAKLEGGRALAVLCAAYHLPALVYLMLAAARPGAVALVGGAILVEQLTYGVGTIGLKVVLLHFVSGGPHKTTHFAFASGLSGAGAALSGLFAGTLQQRLGYPGFFAGVVAVSILALLVVTWTGQLRKRASHMSLMRESRKELST